MRIAYILPSLHTSGWRRYSEALLHTLAKQVEPILIHAAQDSDLVAESFPHWTHYALPVVQEASLSSNRTRWQLLRSLWSVRRLPLPRPDVVHSLEAYPAGLIGHALARRWRVPHALTAHGTYGVFWARYPLDRWAYRQALRGAGMVCPVSHGTADLMQEFFPADLPSERLRVILNGNDFWQRVPREEALTRPWPKTPTVLTVGDLKPRKGIHISLSAFARLQREFPQARYWIVGKYRPADSYFQFLQQLVNEYNLQEAVTFWGRVDDAQLDDLYRQASIFVLASQAEDLRFEGFGLVYIEAGAYGLPAIGTRSGGIPDAVRDGETGLLVPPDNVEALTEAMRRLLTDEALARRLGQANRRLAESLTWQHTAEAWLETYRSL